MRSQPLILAPVQPAPQEAGLAGAPALDGAPGPAFVGAPGPAEHPAPFIPQESPSEEHDEEVVSLLRGRNVVSTPRNSQMNFESGVVRLLHYV